jgi:hypothetical protein
VTKINFSIRSIINGRNESNPALNVGYEVYVDAIKREISHIDEDIAV